MVLENWEDREILHRPGGKEELGCRWLFWIWFRGFLDLGVGEKVDPWPRESMGPEISRGGEGITSEVEKLQVIRRQWSGRASRGITSAFYGRLGTGCRKVMEDGYCGSLVSGSGFLGIICSTNTWDCGASRWRAGRRGRGERRIRRSSGLRLSVFCLLSFD